ncbi:hypothetical protein COU57_01160 [Candidatus Pacearchaeota archaeon CG10_big_fil_rev_8_21_14_0_10_32_14]|nr:MAG: hypothetical protein COU57_01160 [Candidatus Pacearchaeota archaeon CG10_big_fil_rev_8_21_14_0_10_32_14]
MKKRGVIRFAIILVILITMFLFVVFSNMTGYAISGEKTFGPSSQDQQCMMTCMKCTSPGVGCTGNQQECQTKCNVIKPDQTEEESCVESCAKKGCGDYDFSCQEKNQAVCDKECGMIKEPEAKSEEEQCIRDCVDKDSPGLICQGGEGGEKGNEICQRCAKSCEGLYSGPCLTEIKLEDAKKACNTCEHCYGKPVMGDSGEGYECIVNIECGDSSSEFGDDPGTGPGIGQEGFVEKVENVFDDIGNFFKELF